MTEPVFTFNFNQRIPMTIFGPEAMWMAETNLVALEKPMRHAALRSLFSRLYPRKEETERLFMLPGVMLALVCARSVELRLDQVYIWTGPTLPAAELPATASVLRQAIKDGKLSLLLLQAEPALWEAGVNKLPSSVCIAGEIDLTTLNPQANQATSLAQALNLEFGSGHGVAAAGSSGATVRGKTKLPWQPSGENFEGVFQLAPVFPAKAGEANFLLELDRERLTTAQNGAIIRIWNALDGMLTPPDGPPPAWITLEIPKVQEPPKLTWPMRVTTGRVDHLPVHLDPSAFNMILSDQRPNDSANPITSLARVHLRLVTAEQKNNDVMIRTTAGAEERQITPELQMSARLKTHSQNGELVWEESLQLSGISVAYDPVLTPAQIRQDQAIPPPEWLVDAKQPELTQPLEPAWLWGYMPLENGWAQVPLPNLTEQIYADLELTQVTPPATESSVNPLEGAVVYSNVMRDANGKVTVGPGNTIGEQPWSVILTGAYSLVGEWTLKPQSAPLSFRLEEIEINVAQPKMILDGLLWLSNDQPTVANSLPDMDNWIAGLYSVPLESVTVGLPLRIPFIARTITSSDESEELRATLNAAATGDLQKHQELVEYFKGTKLPLNIARCQPGSPTLTGKPIGAESLRVVEKRAPPDATEDEVRRTDWEIHVKIDEGNHAGEHLLYVIRRYQSGQFQIYHPCALPLYDTIIMSLQESKPVALPTPLQQRFAQNDIRLSDSVLFQRPATEARYLLIDTKNGIVCTVRDEGDFLDIRRIGADTFPALVTFDVEKLALSHQVTNQRGTAQLGSWAVSSAISQAVLARMVENHLFCPAAINDTFPLLWLRHGTLPLVQALPLTQNQTPPNYPSPSRQFAPFEIKSADGNGLRWSFGVARDNGAASWPIVAPATKLLERDTGAGDVDFLLQPARAWRKWLDLPLVYLSLPGLVSLPLGGNSASFDPVAQLLLQYRYDLPHTDEINALATLSDPKAAAEESVAPDPTVEEAPRLEPLTLSTYANFWEQLANRAALSALSAVTAIFQKDGESRLRHLIEPYEWPVSLQSKLTEYPGKLQFIQAGSEALKLANDAALRGIKGHFKLDGDLLTLLPAGANGDTERYTVEAGSMATQGNSAAVRDQRGLKRSATVAGSALMLTPIELAGAVSDEYASIQLATTVQAIALTVDEESWQLWFRDLPISATNQSFQRQLVLSASHQDINDPEALARQHDYLQGYEWRLATAGAPAVPPIISPSRVTEIIPLKLYRFDFFPFTLEVARVNSQQVDEVRLTGRLQLPLSTVREREELSNLVTVTFLRDIASGELRVSNIEGEGEWPLQGEGQLQDIRIAWKATGIQDNHVRFTSLQLKHTFFDVPWTHALKDYGLPLNQLPGKIVLEEVPTPDPKPLLTVTISKLELTLPAPGTSPPDDFSHTAELRVDIAMQRTIRYLKQGEPPFTPPDRYYVVKRGDNLWKIAVHFYGDGTKNMDIYEANKHIIGSNPDLIHPGQVLLIPWLPSEFPPLPPPEEETAVRPIFHAQVNFDLLKGVLAKTPIDVQLLGNLTCTTTSLTFAHNTLQIRWDSYNPPATPGNSDGLQLLPGMKVVESSAPGIAFLHFAPRAKRDAAPELRLRTAYLEGLIHCQWGDFLQDALRQPFPSSANAAGTPLAFPVSASQLLKSSAGDFVVGYTAQFPTNNRPGSGRDPAQPDDEKQWSESLLLNGSLEITNLISWPSEMTYAEANSVLTLPAAVEKMNHLRHTVRLLLNQHEIPANLLLRGSGQTVLHLVPSAAWQFLAVAEHQLVTVNQGTTETKVTHERRWTVLQEVRIVHPEHFRFFLETLRYLHTINPASGTGRLVEANQGYLAEHIRVALSAVLDNVSEMLLVEASAHQWVGQQPLPAKSLPSSTNLQYLPTGAQLAVLSRPQDYASPAASVGTKEEQSWLLLSMPFLGRIQPAHLDKAPSNGAAAKLLHSDPIAHLQTLKSDNAATIPPLLLALTNRGNSAAVKIDVSIFDTVEGRLFPRLDHASLEENWIRLHNPPLELLEATLKSSAPANKQPAIGIHNIMAALPNTPGRLSRQAAMEWLYDGYRAFYPPSPNRPPANSVAFAIPDTPHLRWQPDSLFALSHVAHPNGNSASTNVYGWHIVGLQLLGSNLWKPASTTGVEKLFTRHAATTLLPPAPRPGIADLPPAEQQRVWPVSLAVSPYLALEFQRAPQKTHPVVVSAELLALDSFTQMLLPIASQIWEVRNPERTGENGTGNGAIEGDKPTPLTYEKIMQASPEWARAVHLRLSPESPIAILRYREIHAKSSTADATTNDEALVITRYLYAFVDKLQVNERLIKRVSALRSKVVDMRFREGQFGGQQIPDGLENFEIAPPQITGVQPLYILPEERIVPALPTTGELPAEEHAAHRAQIHLSKLPWGLSALWYSTRYTQEGEAVIGAKPRMDPTNEKKALTLWWQSPQQLVQYRSSEDIAEIVADLRADGADDDTITLLKGAVSGLPNSFRARAIKSLLPVIPQPPLPTNPLVQSNVGAYGEESGNGNVQNSAMDWQAILPGEMRFMLLGNRPGAMLALRHQLLRQRLDTQHKHIDTIVSGSIPVQHRVPRPVPLPQNLPERRNQALRPWASYFEPESNVLITHGPSDEAFLVPCELWFTVTQETIDAIVASGQDVPGSVIAELRTLQNVPSGVTFADRLDSATATLTNTTRPIVRGLVMKHVKRIYGSGAARRLRLTLLDPTHGEVDAKWNGKLTFAVHSEQEGESGTKPTWTVRPTLTISATSYTYQSNTDVGDEAQNSFELAEDSEMPREAKIKAIQTMIGQLAPGEAIRIDVSVQLSGDEDNFWQQLSFRALATKEQQLRLPMQPYFVQFEDPEYNHRLSTPAAYITGLVKEERKVGPGNEVVTENHAVKLSADRREYNPTSRIFVRYDWEDERIDHAQLTLQVFRNGSALTHPKTLVESCRSGQLYDIDLTQYSATMKFEAGDLLEVTVKVKEKLIEADGGIVQGREVPIILQLNLVANPVTPTPEAAYALLRKQHLALSAQIQVECTRFAWGPQASRIELVCPKDLQTEIVRRRAVFQWVDVARPKTADGYAIQKIAQSGATHVIEAREFLR